MRLFKPAFAAAVVLLTAPANAATVTEDITFNASPIETFVGPSPAPVDPVTGSIRITLDPSQDYRDASGATLSSINISVSYPLVFNYDHTTDRLEVGGDFGGISTVQNNANSVQFSPSTNDFWLFINGFLSGSPAFDQLGYSQTSVGSDNLDGTAGAGVGGTVSVVTATTPLPAAMPLFLSGLGGIALFARRRKRRAVAA
jgi:hypothetical protein